MSWHANQSATLHFAPLDTGHVRLKVWLAAAVLGLAILGCRDHTDAVQEYSRGIGGSGLL